MKTDIMLEIVKFFHIQKKNLKSIVRRFQIVLNQQLRRMVFGGMVRSIQLKQRKNYLIKLKFVVAK